MARRPYTMATRNAVAQAQGFRNYYEKRQALEYARKGPLAGMFRDVTGVINPNARNPRDLELVKHYYRGYKLNPDDYTLSGDKYRFMELAEPLRRESFHDNLSGHSRWLWDRGRQLRGEM